MIAVSETRPRSRRRNPRGQGGQLRDDIISAATQLIAESGDDTELTLRGLAQEVGIAAPSIYRHFPDIEHLKMAVVDRSFAAFAQERDAASEAADSPAEALLARCRAYCRFALAHPGPYRFMFSHRAPAAGQAQSPAGMTAFAALAASIARCQQTGAAHAADDPKNLAAQVWAALHGMVILRLNAPGFPWPAAIEEMADQAVGRLVLLDPAPSPGQHHHPSHHGESS